MINYMVVLMADLCCLFDSPKDDDSIMFSVIGVILLSKCSPSYVCGLLDMGACLCSFILFDTK